MTVDWTVNVGMLIMISFTLVGFAGGGFGLYFGIKGNLDRHADRLETFGGRMINVEIEMRAMRDILTKVAVQDERMSSMDQRMQQQTIRLDALTERFNRHFNHVNET